MHQIVLLLCLVVLAGCSAEKPRSESFAEFPYDFRGSYSGVEITKEGPDANSRHTVQLVIDENYRVTSVLCKDNLLGSFRKWKLDDKVIFENQFDAHGTPGMARLERQGQDLKAVLDAAYEREPIQGVELELKYDKAVEEPENIGVFHWDKEKKKAVAQLEMLIPKQRFELGTKSLPLALNSNPELELYLDTDGQIKLYDTKHDQMVRLGEQEEQGFVARLRFPGSEVVLSGKNASLASAGSGSKVMADELAVAVEGVRWRATVEIYEDRRALLLSEQGRVRFGADGRPVREAKGSSGVFDLTKKASKEEVD